MKLKNSTGITLIALIITIIVMLILVMVVIRISKDSGLILKAQYARTTTTRELERERLTDAVFTGISSLDGSFNIRNVTLPNDMKWCDESGNEIKEPDTNGNWVITDNNNMFFVKADGSVGDSKKDEDSEKTFIDPATDEITDENGNIKTDVELNDWIFIEEEDNSITVMYRGKETNIVLPKTSVIANQLDYYERGEDDTIFEYTNKQKEISLENNRIVFWYRADIESVNFNDINLEINTGALKDAVKLTTVTGLAGVKRIDDETFSNCTSLANIEFPEGFEYLNANSFNGSGLETIKLPNSVNYISNIAFNNCKNLKNIIINKTEEECSRAGFLEAWPEGVNVTYK